MSDKNIVNEPVVPYGAALSMNPANMLGFMRSFDNEQGFLHSLKTKTLCTDDRISYWLNMNVKTYRNHRDKGVALKPDTREHLIMLTSLISHGISIFGSPEQLHQWLETENFHFDKQKPADLLNTNSGVRLIDDRLSGMEYGDNA